MKFNKRIIGLFALLLIIVSPASLDASINAPQSSDIISEINKERLSRGMSALRADPALSAVAHNRSKVLANAGRIFHLTAPSGTPWPELWDGGYKYTHAGENLALGIESSTELARRWMASPSHRENMLGHNYEDVGVGVTMGYYNNMPVSYVVVYFGKKRTDNGSSSAGMSQTTQANVVARSYSSKTLPVYNPLPSNSSDNEKIRIITQLITYLDSYLRIVQTNEGLI